MPTQVTNEITKTCEWDSGKRIARDRQKMAATLTLDVYAAAHVSQVLNLILCSLEREGFLKETIKIGIHSFETPTACRLRKLRVNVVPSSVNRPKK